MLTKTYAFVVLVAVILASSVAELKAKEEFAPLEEEKDELALLDEEDMVGDKEDMLGDKEDIKDRELSSYGYGGYDNDYYGDNDHYSRPVRRPTRYYYGGNHGGSYYGSRPVRKPVRKPVRRRPSYWNY
jgi:hypothetical protein